MGSSVAAGETSVTTLPAILRSSASSMALGPWPTTATLAGSARRANSPSISSASSGGTAADSGAGREPVARITWPASITRRPTRTVAGARSSASPRMVSTPYRPR